MADPMAQTQRTVGLLEAGDLEGAVAIWSPPNPQSIVAYFAAKWAPTVDEARGEDPVSPMLGFQRIDDHRRPTWPGDDYPEQLHVDLVFDDRPAAQRHAEDIGAELLPPPHGSAPVYADPAGHPFCLGGHGA